MPYLDNAALADAIEEAAGRVADTLDTLYALALTEHETPRAIRSRLGADHPAVADDMVARRVLESLDRHAALRLNNPEIKTAHYPRVLRTLKRGARSIYGGIAPAGRNA